MATVEQVFDLYTSSNTGESMKTSISSIAVAILFFTQSGFSQEPKAKSHTSTQPRKATTTAWKTYGDKITLKKTASLSEVLKNPRLFERKEVLVEGMISEVCQNKGCWMVVDAGDMHVRVEFKEYGFFVPWDSDLKMVRMQGVLEKKLISAKAAEHMAAEMKHPPTDKNNPNTEQTIMVFTANAIAIKGGSKINSEQQDAIDGKKEKEGHEGHDH